MATKNTTYGCDLCDEAWDTKEEAEACERRHVLTKDMTIVSSNTSKYQGSNYLFPESITVISKDKLSAGYKLLKTW